MIVMLILKLEMFDFRLRVCDIKAAGNPGSRDQVAHKKDAHVATVSSSTCVY